MYRRYGGGSRGSATSGAECSQSFWCVFGNLLLLARIKSFAGTSEMLKNYSSIRFSSVEIWEFVNVASESVNNNQTYECWIAIWHQGVGDPAVASRNRSKYRYIVSPSHRNGRIRLRLSFSPNYLTSSSFLSLCNVTCRLHGLRVNS